MSKTLKLISWNVHFPTFARDNTFVAKTIEKLGEFDVICLQEYVQGADTYMQQWFKDNGYTTEYLPFSHRGPLSFGIVIATRTSLKAKVEPTVLRKDGPRRRRPFDNIRGLLTAQLTVGGKKLAIHNIHLTYPRVHTSDMRKREFVKLQEFLKQETGQMAWFLCGDFNFVGADKRRKYLTEQYHNFTGGKLAKTWRHTAHSIIRANIDYFFWNEKDLKIKAKLAKFDASDHRPMIAEISVD